MPLKQHAVLCFVRHLVTPMGCHPQIFRLLFRANRTMEHCNQHHIAAR